MVYSSVTGEARRGGLHNAAYVSDSHLLSQCSASHHGTPSYRAALAPPAAKRRSDRRASSAAARPESTGHPPPVANRPLPEAASADGARAQLGRVPSAAPSPPLLRALAAQTMMMMMMMTLGGGVGRKKERKCRRQVPSPCRAAAAASPTLAGCGHQGGWRGAGEKARLRMRGRDRGSEGRRAAYERA
eukprot:scaffold1237_cov403-Prasinococcus_capsulatus_cf.AAC.14